jgi:hypothetical protein
MFQNNSIDKNKANQKVGIKGKETRSQMEEKNWGGGGRKSS